ncbi:MAG: DUF5615 family PIN-like protein, partial [Thermomicrobia bacterium]|nr:DUF5615 family PIN-like protein [Thermomicrobia bacterium]MCA1725282.1 DUF5615 family PIN-like protein [Thermomicrobia bacterium]
MATFYLDQNISQRIVPFLQEAGHQAITTRSMHFERAGDDEQLFLAWRNGWIMVTHDGNDYLLLHSTLRRWASAWGVTDIHAGILILPYGLGTGAGTETRHLRCLRIACHERILSMASRRKLGRRIG